MIAHSNRWDNLYLLLQALPIMMLVPISQMSHSTRTHNVRVTSSIWQKLEPYKLAQRLLSASNKFYTLVPQVLSWPLHTRACGENSRTEDRLNCGCAPLSECCVYDKRRHLDVYIFVHILLTRVVHISSVYLTCREQDFGLRGMSNVHLIDNIEKVRKKVELVESLLEASCSPPSIAAQAAVSVFLPQAVSFFALLF